MDALAQWWPSFDTARVWLHWASAITYTLLLVVCLVNVWRVIGIARALPKVMPERWIAWQFACMWVLGALLSVHLRGHELRTWPWA